MSSPPRSILRTVRKPSEGGRFGSTSFCKNKRNVRFERLLFFGVCNSYLFISFFPFFHNNALAFFFISYTFQHGSHAARYFVVLLYLKPVSFAHNHFSSQFTHSCALRFCSYILGVIKVSTSPFRFVYIHFLFVVCLS